MATFSCNYLNIWKWLQFDWGSTWVLYWADFNPSDQSDYDADHCTVYQATTSFNLSWFQPWHEVWACAFEIKRAWPWPELTQSCWMDFERYNGSWNIWWQHSFIERWDEIIESQYSWGRRWRYFWVDRDEIWAWYSKYRIHIYAVDGTWDYYSPEFSVSNLSIDSSTHRAWHIWVSWNNLCYVDATDGGSWQTFYWYKHKIAYDSWYSSFVWASHAGSVWLDSDDNLRIYYVDEQGYKRRTYMSDSRFEGNVNVWSSKKWSMRVWVNSAEYWYWYLCFIAPNWSKRRILNWPPAWYQ